MANTSRLILLLLAVVTLHTAGLAQTASRKQVTQFGITWTFDKNYPTGQYANGDWWVVGPVKVVEISPRSVSGSRVKHGSMINPSPTLGAKQGYDNKMKNTGYQAGLNVALNVSASQPLVVQPHSSLVSTISLDPIKTPILAGCQILTVVPAAAKGGDFRPPYCGKDKTSKFNVSQLNYSLLKRLKPTTHMPSLSSIERYFERPWLDHIPGWTGSEHHPTSNMEWYGRDMSNQVSIGAMALHLDLSNAQKEKLMVRYVQLGIDMMGITEDGGHENWMNNGGHASGRKWPILFAGLVLNNTKMKGIGSAKVYFGPDMQTWIVTQADVGRKISPDPRATAIPYVQADVGKPEWGIRHATAPISDNANWNATYRCCCTANTWLGFLLAAHLMDAQTLWNHDPLFLYMDHYLAECRRLNRKEWEISWDRWSLTMWDAYRNYSSPPLALKGSTRRASALHYPRGIDSRNPPPQEVLLKWTKTGTLNNVHNYEVLRGNSVTSLSSVARDITVVYYTDPEVAAGKDWHYVIVAKDKGGAELGRSPVKTFHF